MSDSSNYLNQCLQLAKKGEGYVTPNPLVGAIILKQNKIIAEGYHAKHGDIHAEVDALRKVNKNIDLSDAIMVVNLEPCSHDTPEKINKPCAPQIVESGIRHVIIGMKDPNPNVLGNGIAYLKENSVKVDLFAMDELHYLNRFFIINQREKRPFITLKMAQSLNRKITNNGTDNPWITDEDARAEVHRMRHEHDAVLVGSNTMIADNPTLTVRHIEGKNPIRIIIDSSLKSPTSSNVFNDGLAETWVYTTDENTKKFEDCDATLIQMDKSGDYLDLKEVFDDCFQKGVRSILIEAGSTLSSILIKQNLIDELILMIAPRWIGSGKESFESLTFENLGKAITFVFTQTEMINDQLIFKGMLSDVYRID